MSLVGRGGEMDALNALSPGRLGGYCGDLA